MGLCRLAAHPVPLPRKPHVQAGEPLPPHPHPSPPAHCSRQEIPCRVLSLFPFGCKQNVASFNLLEIFLQITFNPP